MMTREEVAEGLVAGAAQIVEKGHWKGVAAGASEGRECVATSLPYEDVNLRWSCLNALRFGLGVNGWGDIHDWNDRPETTQEDAVQLLVTTAEKVRTGEIKLEGVS